MADVNGTHDEGVERTTFTAEELEMLKGVLGFAHDVSTQLAQAYKGKPEHESDMIQLGLAHAYTHYFLDEKIPLMEGIANMDDELDAFLKDLNK